MWNCNPCSVNYYKNVQCIFESKWLVELITDLFHYFTSQLSRIYSVLQNIQFTTDSPIKRICFMQGLLCGPYFHYQNRCCLLMPVPQLVCLDFFHCLEIFKVPNDESLWKFFDSRKNCCNVYILFLLAVEIIFLPYSCFYFWSGFSFYSNRLSHFCWKCVDVFYPNSLRFTFFHFYCFHVGYIRFRCLSSFLNYFL